MADVIEIFAVRRRFRMISGSSGRSSRAAWRPATRRGAPTAWRGATRALCAKKLLCAWRRNGAAGGVCETPGAVVQLDSAPETVGTAADRQRST